MAKTDPKRRRGRYLGIPTADPAHGKAGESHSEYSGASTHMQEEIIKTHAAERSESQEARRQRYPVRDRHGEKVARCGERHQGRKQHKAHEVEDHGFTQPMRLIRGRSI